MSVDSAPNTSEMAAASTFSYAQAAKGPQGSTAQIPDNTTQASKAESSTSAAPTEKSLDTQASTAETSQAASATEVPPSVAEKQPAESVSGADNESRTESGAEKRTETKRDDETSRLDRPWRRNEKSTRSSSAATRSVDEQDSKRTRKGKKGKNAEKQSGDNGNNDEPKDEPEAPKIELADAAIPSVNIWQQRREAQAARPKPEPVVNSSTSSVAHAQTTSSTTTSAPMNGAKPSPKISDKPERIAPRGNRVATQAKTEVPPPANDAVSWPTPETAVQEDKKPAEKPVEKSGQDEAAAKPRHKNQWQAYDFVPTVTFETQLPPRNAKPRGGAKGASGTRASTNAQNGEKSAGSPPTKATESRDRAPRETANGAPRNASLPPTSKRASMDVANPRGEQRRTAQNNGADKAKDAASSHQVDQHQPREGRSEGRGERGRGGYRGRGGHHAITSHGQPQQNGSAMGAPYPPNGVIPNRSQGPYSPPPRGGHGQMYMPPQQRGGRGARNGGYNAHRMSLPNGNASRLPPLQTQPGPYDYQMQGPMTAIPYQQPYWTPNGLPTHIALLRQQIEYYFSVENLCKDFYLRQHMDSQGFVPLMFICGFKRMRDLEPAMNDVRMVCEQSDLIDFVIAEDDNTERLRPRDGWKQWVYPMDKRDQGAKNEGPARLIYKSQSYHYAPQYNAAMAAPYGVTSPPPYAGQIPYPVGQPAINGMVNGHGGSTQLSADVPDFSPSQPVGESTQLPNGTGPAPVVNGVNGDHASDAEQS